MTSKQTMKIWIVAYERLGDREVAVDVFHTRDEAVAFADAVDEELARASDTCTETSITEYEFAVPESFRKEV